MRPFHTAGVASMHPPRLTDQSSGGATRGIGHVEGVEAALGSRRSGARRPRPPGCPTPDRASVRSQSTAPVSRSRPMSRPPALVTIHDVAEHAPACRRCPGPWRSVSWKLHTIGLSGLRGSSFCELAHLLGARVLRPVVLRGGVEQALVVGDDRRVVVAGGVEAEHLLRGGARPRARRGRSPSTSPAEVPK